MSIFTLKQYSSSLDSDWDNVVQKSKNGNFLHFINYFKYHADRFIDASLLIYKNNLPVAIFPANLVDDTIFSHSGLTYAGLIYGKDLHCINVMQILDVICQYYKRIEIKKIIYKAVPSVFASYPADEDKYALFRLNAKLIRRDVSSVIDIANIPKLSDSRKNTIKKASKNNVEISNFVHIDDFYSLLTITLKKFDTIPTHSLIELNNLIERFPDSIKIYGAYQANELLAVAMVYDFGHIVHTQYLANSDTGRRIGALDFLLFTLINEIYSKYRYFSFGISTEQRGRYLNEGLISQKEGFGGRAVAHDFYELDL